MEFDNSFEVPLPPGEAWPLLMDIRKIAPCMPGAELTEVVDDKTYKGRIAVRLGPVALAFAGLVKFEELDNTNHSARVSAQGSDAKGRGGANASASFRLEPTAAGCKVLVHTDLALSGAVAQYGRGVGMIQATAAQIMGQFAKNLGAMVAQQGNPAASAPPVARGMAPAALPAGPPAAAALHASLPQPPPQPADPAVPPAAKPISGLSLMAKVLWDAIVRMFRKTDHQKP